MDNKFRWCVYNYEVCGSAIHGYFDFISEGFTDVISCIKNYDFTTSQGHVSKTRSYMVMYVIDHDNMVNTFTKEDEAVLFKNNEISVTWSIYEQCGCSKSYHYIQKETCNEIFATPSECYVDFWTNSEYEPSEINLQNFVVVQCYCDNI